MNLKFPKHYKATPIDFPLEPLLIKLEQSVGLLPGGYIFEIPRYEALRLIRHRKATAVGKLGTIADATLTEQEYAAIVD